MSDKKPIEVHLVQDNAKRRITISKVSDGFDRLSPSLAYGKDDIEGKTIDHLLPERLMKAVNDYVEFVPDGSDLKDVLERIRNFSLRDLHGNEVLVRKQLIYHDIPDDDNQHYLMIIYRTSNLNRKMLDDLKELEMEHRDENMGIMRAEGFLSSLEIIAPYLQEDRIPITMAIVRIDDYTGYQESLDTVELSRLKMKVADRMQETFRGSDVIAYAEEGQYGLILLETEALHAEIPFKRFKQLISANPVVTNDGVQESVTASIVYKQLKHNVPFIETIDQLEQKLNQASHHKDMLKFL